MRKELTVKLYGTGKHGEVAAVELPFDVRKVWGKARVPVKGTINGFPFRTTVCTMRGITGFCVNRAMREGAEAGVGDTVKLVIEPDTAPRIMEIPPRLKKVLGQKLTAKLQALAYTHQKEFVRWYTDAKKDETRERRVGKMKEMLATGKVIS